MSALSLLLLVGWSTLTGFGAGRLPLAPSAEPGSGAGGRSAAALGAPRTEPTLSGIDASAATHPVATLTARGELTGQAPDETAVLRRGDAGDGSAIHLVIVAETEAGPRDIATTPLEDGVQVRELAIENGYVRLDLLSAGARDPACCPTRRVQKTYGLVDAELVEVFSEELGTLGIDDIGRGVWRLARFAGGEPLPEGVEITASFSGRNLSGSSGCNRYYAAVESDGAGEIRLGPPAATRMACDEPARSAEDRYLEALTSVERFGFDMGHLMMRYRSDEGPRELLFELSTSAPEGDDR